MKFTGKLKLMAAPLACAGGVLLGGCCTDPSTEAFKLPPQVELLPGAKFENDPMRAQWAFLPINEETLRDAPEDWAEQEAQKFYERGITHVMTFGNLHYRWSYRRYFKEYNALLAQLVTACHKRGMRVVEHHSSNIMYDFDLTPEECVASKIPRLDGADEDWSMESEIDGVPLKNMLQYSGRTGKPLNEYGGYIMCPNNPHYQKVYFSYLEDTYATGVDGIMTDDVEFFADDTCACDVCREMFRERTGYDLPPSGDSEAWDHFLNEENTTARYYAWKAFRYDTCVEFHQKVVDHYHALGLELLRPNYIATALSWANPWAYVFDDLPELDWGFQEAYGGALRYSWPEYLFETRHRNMICDRRGIPALTLYYPANDNQIRFSWALALWAGQRAIGNWDVAYRNFEKEHFDSLRGLTLQSDVAIFDSTRNRELSEKYNSYGCKAAIGPAQAMIHHNIPFRVVSTPDAPYWEKTRLLIVPETAFLSDADLAAFKEFVHDGGILWITPGSGERIPEDFSLRSRNELLAALDIPENSVWEPGSVFRIGRGKIVVKSYNDLAVPYTGRAMAGEGFTFVSDEGKKQIAELAADISAAITAPPILTLTGAPEDVIAAPYFDSDGRMSLHLVNAHDSMKAAKENGQLNYNDEIPFPMIEDPITIVWQKPFVLEDRVFSTAKFFTLESEPKEIAVEDLNSSVRFTIPGKTLKDYLLITLQ